MTAEQNDAPRSAAASKSSLETQPTCPCAADHCQVCGALGWRLDRVSGGEPWLYCGRCGSIEGATSAK